MKATEKVEISHRTIMFTVFFLLSMAFLYHIRDLILQLFVALLIMSILSPLVDLVEKLKIPRSIAVAISYLMVIGVLVFSIANISKPLIEQSTNFVNGLPVYIETLGLETRFGENVIEDFLTQIGVVPAHFAQFALSIFSNALEVLTVLIFAFYMLVSRHGLGSQVGSLFGKSRKEKATTIFNKLENKLGSWARGQLLLMFMVGMSTYIGLVLLGVPFALPLAILAGLLEVVPLIGPIIAAVPSVIIGMGISPVIGIATIALAFLIQQVENYIFIPSIMKKAVGMSSLLILLSLAIGFRLFGIIGAIVSIPAVLTMQILIEESSYFSKKLS